MKNTSLQESYDDLIKKIYNASDLQHKQIFVLLLNEFRLAPNDIFIISPDNILYNFIKSHHNMTYDNLQFIISQPVKSNDINIVASYDFRDYLQSDLFKETFNDMTYSLLKGESL